MSTNNALRKALVAATAAGALVILGGCADGTHPGAAAVVGNQEISVSEVQDITAAANKGVKEAAEKLKLEQKVPELTPDLILGSLVQASRVDQVVARKSVTPSPAEIAAARKELGLHQVYTEGFQLGGPLTQAFYEALVRSALGQAKLAGSTAINDQNVQAAGAQIVAAESRNIEITISPRYGKWDPAQGLVVGSGSLSVLSPQAEAEKAKRDAEKQQPQG